MIRRLPVIGVLISLIAPWSAAQETPAVGKAPRPRQVPPVTALSPASATAAALHETKFVTEAKWVLAGYNNNEIVYQIFVTSQDSRIIRCTTDVAGFYIENGKKLTITDRQVTTVFPEQPTQVGTWMDMDQASGATYSVKCRAV